MIVYIITLYDSKYSYITQLETTNHKNMVSLVDIWIENGYKCDVNIKIKNK